jgi:hypothetical protein
MTTQEAGKYALLLDGNQRAFALVRLPADAADIPFQVLEGHAGWAQVVREAMVTRGIQVSNLAAVLVRQGKGSFSDTRSVTILANLLSHFASVPVGEVKESDPWFLKNGLPAQTNPIHIKPGYYAEPNITQAK